MLRKVFFLAPGLVETWKFLAGKKLGSYRYLNMAMSFGISACAGIYFGHKAGVWLDEYFGTESLCAFFGILFGIYIAFLGLFEELKHLDEDR